MKNYYRIMLGKKSIYAEEGHKMNVIGAGWLYDYDLTGKLPDNWREFNQKTIPIYIQQNPDKTKVAAGLACGMLHTITKGITIGDIVLCPDGKGSYYAGEVTGDYFYHGGKVLPHRRSVNWFPKQIARDVMSEELKNSSGSIGTVSNITKYAEEIESLLLGSRPATLISTDATIENPSVFALEKHLEDFLPRAMEIFGKEKVNLKSDYMLEQLKLREDFGDIRKYVDLLKDIYRNHRMGRIDQEHYR